MGAVGVERGAVVELGFGYLVHDLVDLDLSPLPFRLSAISSHSYFSDFS